MNKKELVDIVSQKKDLTKKDAEALVDTVFDTMIESILEGDKVLISGFGTFKVNARKERKGVSPKTKEMMIIPASKTVTFKPSNRLKDAMN
ncbi:MAG: HU family DNA-binding protein [Erysipelotrichales bacterium]|nr:HU family DNA-binding protein [Erysipelotrichales bacterium]